MSAGKFLTTYTVMAIVFLAIDIVWLGFIAKGFYARYLGHLFRDRINWPAAFIFYALFVLGIMIFAVQPWGENTSLARAALLGALYGLFTYATYDLTNLATLKGWPLEIVVVDISWGIVLCAMVSTVGYLAARLL
jgi:uncharacterized membrane protein